MRAQQFIESVLTTMIERGQQRDQPNGERSLPAVVTAFNAITGHALTAEQGALFMVLLKARRAQQGKPDPDNYVDGAAYFALAGEEALKAAHARSAGPAQAKIDGDLSY